MTLSHVPLRVNQELTAVLRNFRNKLVPEQDARDALGTLLQSALQLEFATIPTYLSAAFSLSSNRQIQGLILRTSQEEMLHMTAVANLMNAIGIAPNIVAAVPNFPYSLTIIDPPLRLDLLSFSPGLVENLFKQIEVPEDPVLYKEAAVIDKPATVGQFYAGIIEIIADDVIPDLFENAIRDAYKQRTVVPNFRPVAYVNNSDTNTYPLKPEIDFKITDKGSAVRHLEWLVDQGEGAAPFDPLTAEGIPGHYYRFESILKSRYLIRDDDAPLEYSYSGGDLPFDPKGVHVFDANAKAGDYGEFPEVEDRMRRFNEQYTEMIDLLQAAFNCASPAQQEEAAAAYDQAIGVMRRMPSAASAIVRKAREKGIRAGIPFEYAGAFLS